MVYYIDITKDNIMDFKRTHYKIGVIPVTPLPLLRNFFPDMPPQPNFQITSFTDFLLLNGKGRLFLKIIDNLEVVTISDYILVQTQTGSEQTRTDQTRVAQTRSNALTFLNHNFLGLTRFNFKRGGRHTGKSVFKITPITMIGYPPRHCSARGSTRAAVGKQLG